MRYELTNVMVKSYQTSGSADAADSFDFTAAGETQEMGLLLPAVQKAPEAARPTGSETSDDSFEFKAADSETVSDGGHDDWIPILDIGEPVRTPATETDEAYLADYVAPLGIDDGKSHHDAWQDGG